MRLVLSSLLFLFVVSFAPGQDTGVILLDARDEHSSCITRPNALLVNTTCGDTAGLSLGRAVRLLSLHRRFMTNYALEFGQVENRPTGQQSLGGVVSPISLPGATPAAAQPFPAIERKTALDFLGLLVDVTSASDAVAEINRENQTVESEFGQVSEEIRAFNQKYASVVGGASPPVCTPAGTKVRGIWLEVCLQNELNAVANWSSTSRDEKTFRDLVARAGSLFEIVKDFGVKLADADLVANARAMESNHKLRRQFSDVPRQS